MSLYSLTIVLAVYDIFMQTLGHDVAIPANNATMEKILADDDTHRLPQLKSYYRLDPSLEETKSDAATSGNQSSPCTVTVDKDEIKIDCRYQSINKIDSLLFQENVTSILLDVNLLKTIPDNVFMNLRKLRNLSVSFNILEHIEPDAFLGLVSLEFLNLENNKLKYGSLPGNVFCVMQNLRQLLLLENANDEIYDSYPNEFLGCLKNLSNLTINISGKQVYFKPEFRNLTNLDSLYITGLANFINDRSFINVPGVRNLTLHNLLYLSNVSTNMLHPFQNLAYFMVENFRVGTFQMLRLLSPLAYTVMDTLRMEALTVSHTDGIYEVYHHDVILDADKTKYLTRICVSRVTLKRSEIIVVTTDAFVSETWDRCLKSLDLSFNPLIGLRFALLRLLKFNNLEELIISHKLSTRTISSKPFPIPFNQFHRSELNAYEFNIIKGQSVVTSKSNSTSRKVQIGSKYQFTIYVSRSLRHLIFREFIDVSYLNRIIHFKGADRVVQLDFSNCGFTTFTGEIHGFTGLKILNASGTDLRIVSVSFLDTFPNVEVLSVANSLLPNWLLANYGDRLFHKLTKLKLLDLSSNSLALLHQQTFTNAKYLKRIRLANNRFQDIPFELKATKSLQMLDLRDNAITTLGPKVTKQLDEMAERQVGFELLLAGNILSCGCLNLKFLLWLQITTVKLDKGRNYSCINDEGLLTYTLSNNNLEYMWRLCHGQIFFYVSLVLFLLLMTGYSMFILIHKNKTYIVSQILQMFTSFKLKAATDYPIGVFIGYASTDYRFACVDLRLFIEDQLGYTTHIRDRDLPVGATMAQSIVEAINSSWRAILVCSEQFLHDDDWAVFTMKAAVYSVTPDNPGRLVVLVEENHLSQLPLELVLAVPEDNIIIVTSSERGYELYDKLKTCIGISKLV